MKKKFAVNLIVGLAVLMIVAGIFVVESGNVLGALVSNPVLNLNLTSFSFNGSQYYTIPDDNKLDFGTGNFSVSVWARSIGSPQTFILDKGYNQLSATSQSIYGYDIYITSNTYNSTNFEIWEGMSISARSIAACGFTNKDWQDGSWHLMTFVVDRNSRDVICYLDGVEKSSNWANKSLFSPSLFLDTPEEIAIGTQHRVHTHNFIGGIQNIQIYDRALNSAEVQELNSPLQNIGNIVNVSGADIYPNICQGYVDVNCVTTKATDFVKPIFNFPFTQINNTRITFGIENGYQTSSFRIFVPNSLQGNFSVGCTLDLENSTGLSTVRLYPGVSKIERTISLATCIPQSCKNNLQCNDNNPLTYDYCLPIFENSSCQHIPIACANDLDCGTSGFTGREFCSSKDVQKSYLNYSCVNAGSVSSYCSVKNISRTINSCRYACSSGNCIGCNSNSDCNDENSNTQDICMNPGNATSYCKNELTENSTSGKIVNLTDMKIEDQICRGYVNIICTTNDTTNSIEAVYNFNARNSSLILQSNGSMQQAIFRVAVSGNLSGTYSVGCLLNNTMSNSDLARTNPYPANKHIVMNKTFNSCVMNLDDLMNSTKSDNFEKKCFYKGNKYSNGERFSSNYCDNGKLREQKLSGETCKASYECESNSCSLGVCKGLAGLSNDGFVKIKDTTFNFSQTQNFADRTTSKDQSARNNSLVDSSGMFWLLVAFVIFIIALLIIILLIVFR